MKHHLLLLTFQKCPAYLYCQERNILRHNRKKSLKSQSFHGAKIRWEYLAGKIGRFVTITVTHNPFHTRLIHLRN